jgi:tetratricopeptide (TPR) repeat protein
VVAARAALDDARPLGHAPTLAAALFTSGSLEIAAGDIDAGIEQLYAAARAGAEARDDERVAQAMNELVAALGSRKQRFEAAETAFQLAAAATARAGNEPRLLAQLYSHRALALFRKGEYATALPLRAVVLALVSQVHGPRSYEVAMQLNYTAATYDMLGRSGEARTLYERSVVVGREAFGDHHPRLGSLLNNYAVHRMNAFDFDGAAALFEQVVELQRQAFAEDDPTLAEAVHNLGTARFYQRRLPEARELTERALRARRGKLGAEHPKIAESLEVLANIDLFEGRHGEALDGLKEAIAIQHRAFGAAHPKLAGPYRGVTELNLVMGRLREARAAAESAVDIDRKTIGEENPQFGLSLTALADVMLAEGKAREALPVYARALALLEKEYGADGVGAVFAMLGVCDAGVEIGAPGARAACARALEVARRAPPEIGLRAELSMARADWAAGGARAAALAAARAARERQAALGYDRAGLERFDRWLAGKAHASPVSSSKPR